VSWSEICLGRVNNEIHDIEWHREALPSQVVQVVIKGQRAGKGHILFSDQTEKV